MMQKDQNKSLIGERMYLRETEQQVRNIVQGVQEMFSLV